MSEELPPPMPENTQPPSDEDDLLFEQVSQPPPYWRRLVIIGLVVLAVLAVGAISLMVYFGVVAWQRQLQQFSYGLAPATPRGQGPFNEVTRFKTDAYVQAIGGGDVDGDGQAEAVVWTGKNVTVRDLTAQEETRFPSRLSEITRVRVPGGWQPVTPGGGIRRPQIAILKGKPAIVVTDGSGESVFAYRADGGLVLENRVPNSHVRCLAVGDVDGDGEDELLVGRSSAIGLVCVDSAGKTKWKHGGATDPSWVRVGDGNGDGKPEVFVGYDTAAAHVLDGTGKRIGEWTQWFLVSDAQCADLDGDRKVDFLLNKSRTPNMPGAGGAGSSSAGSSGPGAPYGLGIELQGVDADGQSVWSTALPSGQYWALATHLGHGDFDADGKGEWIASAPDGTIRVYDVAGNEIGDYALGEEIQTLGVVGSGRPGEKPQVWVSLGEQVVVLQWQ